MIEKIHIFYPITKLDNHHDKQGFSCGSVHLDHYIKTQANQDTKKNVSITYITTASSTSNKVIGYYTMSSTGIETESLPLNTLKKLPKYPILPGILLGRLAVDKNYHGKKIGSHLLADALKRSYSISTQVGITAVVVDAKDEKISNFYKYHGFIKFPDNSSKLFLPMSTIKKLHFENKVIELESA